MLNNIGLPGITLILLMLLIFALPIWLIVKLSNRKASERKRIADALEEIAKSQSDNGRK